MFAYISPLTFILLVGFLFAYSADGSTRARIRKAAQIANRSAPIFEVLHPPNNYFGISTAHP